MLIRVSGGNSGIVEYLIKGKKRSTDLSRDERDERRVLWGDLDVVEQVLGTMNGTGEKYLHVSVGFREEEVAPEILDQVVTKISEFAMIAYRSDEYVLYAEAHLPRVKQIWDHKKKVFKDRLPHIHIVIPRINLYSGKDLNPFGRYMSNLKYLEAFQNLINTELGLANPQAYRRLAIEGKSEMISGSRADPDFGASRKSLKELVQSLILEKDIRSQADLAKALGSMGSVRVRNEGKENSYLNLKLHKPDAESTSSEMKGTNLKEYFFSNTFLKLDLDEKKRLMNLENGPTRNDIQKPSNDLLVEMKRLVQEWVSIRAREVKYINSGHQRLVSDFARSDTESKQLILDNLEKTFYQRHCPPDQKYQSLADDGPVIQEKETVTPVNSHWKETSNSVLGQLVKDSVHKKVDSVVESVLSKELWAMDLREFYLKVAKKFQLRQKDNQKANLGVPRPLDIWKFLRKWVHIDPLTAWRKLKGLGGASSPQIPVKTVAYHEARVASNLLYQEFQRRKQALWEHSSRSVAEKRKQEQHLQFCLVLSYHAAWAGRLQSNSRLYRPVVHNTVGPESNANVPMIPVKLELPSGWSSRPLTNGHTQYHFEGTLKITDQGKILTTHALDQLTLETTLRVAVKRYGRRLHLTGSDEFKRKMALTSVRLGLKVEFDDPKVQAYCKTEQAALEF